MIASWYAIAGFMLVVYVLLDGRNFGAGMLHWRVARTPAERRHHPVMHLLRLEKGQRRTLECARLAVAVDHRDQEIAAVRQRDADGGVARRYKRQRHVRCGYAAWLGQR